MSTNYGTNELSIYHHLIIEPRFYQLKNRQLLHRTGSLRPWTSLQAYLDVQDRLTNNHILASPTIIYHYEPVS